MWIAEIVRKKGGRNKKVSEGVLTHILNTTTCIFFKINIGHSGGPRGWGVAGVWRTTKLHKEEGETVLIYARRNAAHFFLYFKPISEMLCCSWDIHLSDIKIKVMDTTWGIS